MQGKRAGQGGGRGSRTGQGPGGTCVCPKCGHSEPHQRGTSCFDCRCPKCDVPLIRGE